MFIEICRLLTMCRLLSRETVERCCASLTVTSPSTNSAFFSHYSKVDSFQTLAIAQTSTHTLPQNRCCESDTCQQFNAISIEY